MAVKAEQWARPLTIEAIGDDFALVSGEYLSGTRVAAHLRRARQAWAFAAPNDAAAVRLMDGLPAQADTRVIGIVPGAGDGWDAAEREAIGRLLGGDVPAGWTAGLALSIDPPDCTACPGRHCAACAKSPDAR